MKKTNDPYQYFENIIIGAGAAGLFLAGEIKTSKTLILESNPSPGKKIIISGGGRCNFTNKNITFNDFHSQSKNFYRSALKSFSQDDFINLVKKENIPFYEKKLGQLFCENRSKDILVLLLNRIKSNTQIKYNSSISETDIKKIDDFFIIKTKDKSYKCKNLIIASGGPPMPKIGGSNLSQRVANNFGLKTEKFLPALVPIFEKGTQDYSGISIPVEIKVNKKIVADDLLFTHKGFSGPAILKLTLWAELGDEFKINWDPFSEIDRTLYKNPSSTFSNALSTNFPNRFAKYFLNRHLINDKQGPHSKKTINKFLECLHGDVFTYLNNEGFRKAEVAKGGISTKELDAKTMQTKKIKGLYFIGEAIDVTGLLGGYNFQWAWSSAHIASKNIN